MKKAFLTFSITTMLVNAACSQMSIDTSAFVKNNRQLYAVVVWQNDKTLYKQSFNAKTGPVLFNNQSLTKGVMSLLIGIAIDKGYITSADEKIVKYFPQLKQDTDRRKQDITIRDIMNQASGLWHEDLTRLRQYLSLGDQAAYILAQPLVSQPGKLFHYNNAASHLLSVIITKATRMTTLEFGEKYLFGPLGIKNVEWGKMRDGYYDGSGLLSVRTAIGDMNKIGSLLLHEGNFEGKRVVSANWIVQILNPKPVYNTPWGFKGSTYGLCWYHYSYQGTPVSYGLGWGGQFVFIIPAKNAIISVNESINDLTAIKASNLFLDKIFPLIYQQLK